MRRRDFVKRLSAGIVLGPLVLKLEGCVGDTEVPTSPGGGSGGGGDAGSDLLQFRVTNSDTSGHSHWFWIECSQVEAGADTTYTAEGSHTHLVTVTGDDLDRILAGDPITINTNDSHPHTWIIQMPSGMCSGDGTGTPPPDDEGGGGGGGGGGGW